MVRKLGLDFGNANTVVCVWDDVEKRAYVERLGPFTFEHPFEETTVPLVPSLIHYQAGKRKSKHSVGGEVVEAKLVYDQNTVGRIKRNLLQDVRDPHDLENDSVKFTEAGEDFLSNVLRQVRERLGITGKEIAISVPVDGFEPYTKWLANVCGKEGFSDIRMIDEPVAAALSMVEKVRVGDVYVVFDFGAGTLDVAVVRYKLHESDKGEKLCEVIGKDPCDLGGDDIDNWLYEHFLEHHQLNGNKSFIAKYGKILRGKLREAKEELSSKAGAGVSITDLDGSGKSYGLELDQELFESILAKNKFEEQILGTIEKALKDAKQKYFAEELRGVLLVGGSSLIPAVRRMIEKRFKGKKVFIDQPLDAVGLGAAVFVGGKELFDYIQHHYEFGCIDSDTGEQLYERVVNRGEGYPSDGPIATKTLAAAHAGQNEYELVFYEASEESGSVEQFVLGHGGNNDQRLQRRCLNAGSPKKLVIERHVPKDHKAFDVLFFVDEQKHLRVTVYRYEASGKRVLVGEEREKVLILR
jgi:molecular chaperone DnaK (HSP70)